MIDDSFRPRERKEGQCPCEVAIAYKIDILFSKDFLVMLAPQNVAMEDEECENTARLKQRL